IKAGVETEEVVIGEVPGGNSGENENENNNNNNNNNNGNGNENGNTDKKGCGSGNCIPSLLFVTAFLAIGLRKL
ncbi:MAG: hypothetical protein ACI4S9_05890, partial [Christensenellales bacterium]